MKYWFCLCVLLTEVLLRSDCYTFSGGGDWDDVIVSPMRSDANGYIWVTGYTGSSLGSYSLQGGSWPDTDYFFAKVDSSSGQSMVFVQNGTSYKDQGIDLALTTSTTSPAPYVYILGCTYGEFTTNEGYAGKDYFIAKYDSLGAFYWVRSYGYTGDDHPYSMAIDTSTNDLYVLGMTYGNASYHGCYAGTGGDICANQGSADFFLDKVNANGVLQWSRMLGTNETEFAGGLDFSTDVFIGGYSAGTFNSRKSAGSTDVVIAKYATTGAYSAVKSFGSSTTDTISSMAIDGSFLYAVGRTYDYTDSADDYKLYQIATSDLTKNWEVVGGTDVSDWAEGLAFLNGDIYVVGTTAGSFSSYVNQVGQSDYFVAKHSSSDGAVSWTKQGGTYLSDTGHSLLVYSESKIYVSGKTKGDISNPSSTTRKYYWDFFISDDLAKTQSTLWDNYEEYFILAICVLLFFGGLCLIALLCFPCVTIGCCGMWCYNRCCRKSSGYGLIE